jgi:transposase
MTIPGVDALTAAAIIAEIGIDMAAFGTARRLAAWAGLRPAPRRLGRAPPGASPPGPGSARRLAAWAGLRPANHGSAGKRKKRGTREGDMHLKATLVAAAISASQAGATYLRDKFHRLKARMSAKKAAVAIAHKILVALFHMLRRAVTLADLGADHLDRLDQHRTAGRLIRRLNALGYEVMLQPKAAT